jgi:hypothetical protein
MTKSSLRSWYWTCPSVVYDVTGVQLSGSASRLSVNKSSYRNPNGRTMSDFSQNTSVGTKYPRLVQEGTRKDASVKATEIFTRFPAFRSQLLPHRQNSLGSKREVGCHVLRTNPVNGRNTVGALQTLTHCHCVLSRANWLRSVEAQLEGGLKRKPYTASRAAQPRSNTGVSCRRHHVYASVWDIHETNPRIFKG